MLGRLVVTGSGRFFISMIFLARVRPLAILPAAFFTAAAKVKLGVLYLQRAGASYFGER
jgi:hypothetical protein